MVDSEKRKDILKAAGQCFARFGFSKTTMDDIGNLVGLNKASLYYYYKNKEAIFCEIIEQEGEKFISSLKEKINDLPGWDKKVQAYLLERRRYFLQTSNLHNLSIQTAEQLKFQPMFRALANRFSDRESDLITGLLNQALEEGDIRKVDTKRTASIILTLANSLKNDPRGRQKMELDQDESDIRIIEEDTRFAVGLILDGLRNRK